MQILYNDLVRKSAQVENAVGAVFVAELDELLARADCVALAAPFAGQTLINAERLKKLKPGARFINIARGSLVDEEALVRALDLGCGDGCSC